MTPSLLGIPLKFVLRIAQRDHWQCHICGDVLQPNVPGLDRWQIDHDQARAKGGKNLIKNLRLAHARCNGEKADA